MKKNDINIFDMMHLTDKKLFFILVVCIILPCILIAIIQIIFKIDMGIIAELFILISPVTILYLIMTISKKREENNSN